MNRIRLLPEQVANQIAAGEVIERPASVVKELVENALDAEARRITVEVQAGGRALIRVTDDGFGMSKDDALLCLERHATSKIRRAEDLTAIATMGFRGEALPSIASVSRFTLTTREREGDTPEATQVIIHGGRILEVKSAGHAPGTSVEARQLFYNLPARRKFLRSEETERVHVQHYLTLAALAFPEVAFTFVHDHRLVWQLPPLKTDGQPASKLVALKERLRALLGADVKLLPVDFSAEAGAADALDRKSFVAHRPPHLRIWGFIGAPGVSRATRQDQHLFVNRRPVENRALNHALLEGYHTALMKGRYPVCCLFLELDSGEVDVNVHPAKREVKFHQERAVRQFVIESVRNALLSFNEAPQRIPEVETRVGNVKRDEVPGKPGEAKPVPEFSTPQLPDFPLPLKPIPERPARPGQQPPLKMGFAVSNEPPVFAPQPETNFTQHPTHVEPPAPFPPPIAASATVLPSNAGSADAVPLLKVPLRLIGVVGRLYVVLESDRGLVLMDQHAAHERVLFEQMLHRLERGDAPSQRLLLPETVELSARDAQFLREHLPVLGRLGVGLSEFGERTFLLDALPPFVKVADARHFVLELIDELAAAGREVNAMRLGEHVVAKTVCRHAVKANDPLTKPELENLLDDLRNCAMPYTCPHGRPTLIEMNFRELDKKFGRQQ